MVDSGGKPDGKALDYLPDDSRERGFLTEPDRRYLRGTSDVEPRSQNDRRTRQRIRDRTYHALLDFMLVFESMEDRDIRRVFSNRESAEDYDTFGRALDAALAFLYLGTRERLEQFGPHLNAAINNAVNRSSGDRRLVANVEFDVSVSDPVDVDIDGVIDKMANHKDHELSEGELRTFLRWYALTSQFDPEAAREQIHEEREEQGTTRAERGE
jgi:hypothetical protein